MQKWFGGVGRPGSSTSGELLSSLVALEVFKLKDDFRRRRVACFDFGGGTDNKATGQLVRRRLGTKWPVMVALMDYLGFCEEKSLQCRT